ncbi:hypothetical protein RclHR1_00590036 [Rhizophagus clarus]|uniref:Uncharacterized protein n=1 Tax=Rhizophagus clarus TaxID=94130 RepID=A0A2Z6S6M3_9GLOM|nr:hypothetical protein RclHR1_00590036 [Rhizophagus clarus]
MTVEWPEKEKCENLYLCYKKAYKLEASANISNVLIGGKIDKVDIDDVQIEFGELAVANFKRLILCEPEAQRITTMDI